MLNSQGILLLSLCHCHYIIKKIKIEERAHYQCFKIDFNLINLVSSFSTTFLLSLFDSQLTTPKKSLIYLLCLRSLIIRFLVDNQYQL